jgi:Ca-activated chloride channel family protein
MKRYLGALCALLSALFTTPTLAQTTWVGGSPHHTQVLVGADGHTWVGVWVDVPTAAPQQPQVRAPMAVSLVVDTSGSMAGEKIQHARMAAASLIESLADGDVVSIYAFSSGVTEMAPPTVMSSASRGMLLARVQQLQAQGGTNMWDGMQAGIARMGQAPPSHPVRRIFLISDGQANIGPSDPASLGNLAANATERGTQVTAIGVGYDYDQATLGAMAVRSSGRLYHLGQSHQMATILQQELLLMARSVALNAYIEVVPAPGVLIVEGATAGAQVLEGRLRMPLGAMHGGQRREVLFRARVDTSQPGDRPLATARFVYETPAAPQAQVQTARVQTAQVRYQVTRDRNAQEASVAPRVMAMVVDHDAAMAQQRAAALLAEGRRDQAVVVLSDARQRAERAAAAAPAPARARVQQRAGTLGRATHAAEEAQAPADMRARSYEFADQAMEAQGY